ncbi:MAG: DUF2807 domain-containing protein [Bacteroidaceae bacterium]|nr:DUF2807 domain-containing protein [Bacteroidaceae bacterium]
MKKFVLLVAAIATIASLSCVMAKTPSPAQRTLSRSTAAPAAKGSVFTTRTYDLQDFTILDVSNVVKVVYTQGNAYSVKLTGRAELLDEMEVTATGGQLKVSAKRSKKFNNVKQKDRPDGKHNFILQLTAPCLENILLSGVSTFETTAMMPDFLFVRLEGVSKLKANSIESQSLKMSISGCSEVHVGSVACKEYEASMSGSSKVDIQKLTAEKGAVTHLNGASKATHPSLAVKGRVIFNVNGASKLTLSAKDCESLQVGFSGASKGEVSFKGNALRTWCTGASKLDARLDCASVQSNCDGASKINLSGTADKVEIERGGVATNIDTSHLNQF